MDKSLHTLKNAVDIVPQRMINGKMVAIWNAKDKETLELIKIMISYGFEAGANWTKNIDSPHFQIADVDSRGKVFSTNNTNNFVTKMIQKKLNEKIDANLIVDGIWGSQSTTAVNKFRKQNNWAANGKLGAIALEELLK